VYLLSVSKICSVFTLKNKNSRINQGYKAPMLTFWFYKDWNTDIYWQIFATPVVLKQTVESINYCSVGPRLDICASCI
jgi:hypothetical protein